MHTNSIHIACTSIWVNSNSLYILTYITLIHCINTFLFNIWPWLKTHCKLINAKYFLAHEYLQHYRIYTYIFECIYIRSFCMVCTYFVRYIIWNQNVYRHLRVGNNTAIWDWKNWHDMLKLYTLHKRVDNQLNTQAQAQL